jgi:hypothetical protein
VNPIHSFPFKRESIKGFAESLTYLVPYSNSILLNDPFGVRDKMEQFEEKR